MDSPPWSNYIAIIISSLLFVRYLLARRRAKYILPPGPKSWPIIGNLNLMGPLPHRSIHDLSLKYGPIMSLRFGSFPVVVASSLDMVKSFLKTHDVIFADRPKIAAGKYTTYNYSDMTWSPYGAYWRQARKLFITELFSARRLESYEYIRVEETRLFLNDLYKSTGRPIVLKEYLADLSLNVISRMVLGKKYLKTTDVSFVSSAEFKWMIEELFYLNGVLNIGDSIPWLNFLDLQGYIKRMKKLSKMFDRFLEHVLDEHNQRRVEEGKKFVPKDMVDVLLQLADDDRNLEVKIKRDGVKAFTQDLLAGGTESSAVTVEWAISELLKKPEIFKKAAEELNQVVGTDRWVEEKDMHHLPYIEAIVKETMRLHPVAPLLSPRLSREDVTINGYEIPAGTRILVSVWTVGRDPSVWDKPEEFKPERFIDSLIDVKGQDFELLPFGSGRRMCPGYNLGLKVIQLSLANLLQGFSWRLPDGIKKEDLSMEEIFGLSTPKKEPLRVVIEQKLRSDLYGV